MYFLVKTIEKIIKHSLSSQIFQEHINSIITGIILPKHLQIQFFKFYSKDWLFFKISDKLQIASSQFHDLMLLRKFDACFDFEFLKTADRSTFGRNISWKVGDFFRTKHSFKKCILSQIELIRHWNKKTNFFTTCLNFDMEFNRAHQE